MVLLPPKIRYKRSKGITDTLSFYARVKHSEVTCDARGGVSTLDPLGEYDSQFLDFQYKYKKLCLDQLGALTVLKTLQRVPTQT